MKGDYAKYAETRNSIERRTAFIRLISRLLAIYCRVLLNFCNFFEITMQSVREYFLKTNQGKNRTKMKSLKENNQQSIHESENPTYG